MTGFAGTDQAPDAGAKILPSEGTKIVVQEVGPRDGLQLIDFVPTADKISLIQGLCDTGVEIIQATSFVHPRAVPQFSDAEMVSAALPRNQGTRFSALIPNRRGGERAAPFFFDVWELMYSVTDAHSHRNAGRSSREAMDEMSEVTDLARVLEVEVVGSVAVAFGCPFEGAVSYSAVAEAIDRWGELGVRTVNVADTIGVANPRQVFETCTALREAFPDMLLGLHLHDTRGLALANTVAGLAAGIHRFDSSVGGLGGCPFAPGASGNVASEDLVHLLQASGLSTSIDFAALQTLANDRLAEFVVASPTSSMADVSPIWGALGTGAEAQAAHLSDQR